MRDVAKWGTLGVVAIFLASACISMSPPERRSGQAVDVLLTPVMMEAGLDMGMSFLPATLKTNVLDLDRMLKQAKAVSLDDVYKSMFGVGIRHPDVDPKTGDILRQAAEYGIYKYGALDKAQAAFYHLLLQQRIPEDQAQRYVLVGNYKWAWSRDQIIFVVSYRHSGMEPISVISKETGKVTRLKSEDAAWREAFQKDVEGQPIDEIIDWAALSYSSLRSDRAFATLILIAVEAIKKGKRSPDFWPAERRWLSGDTDAIVQESGDRVKRALLRN